MAQPNKDPKEVRLFGEKSIREEAYRQKILQLERELVNLEALAKGANASRPKQKPSENLDGLYYESLISFDKKLKNEQESLEKRATEITERFDVQAQRLITDMEVSFRRKTRWLILSVAITGVALVIALGFLNINFIKTKTTALPAKTNAARISYIRTALQTQTKYHHQYEVTNIDTLSGAYIIEMELDSVPASKWYLRDISQDVVNVLQKYTTSAAVEISFLHKGKLYLKTYLSASSSSPHFQYFY